MQESFGDAPHRNRIVDNEGERSIVGRRWCGLLKLDDRCAGSNQRMNIENQHDAAIAENRRAGNAANARELRAHSLDDDFPARHQLVNEQGRREFAGMHENHWNRCFVLGQLGRLAAEVHA